MSSPIRDPGIQEHIEKAATDYLRLSKTGTGKMSVTFDFKENRLMSISTGFSSSRTVFQLPKK